MSGWTIINNILYHLSVNNILKRIEIQASGFGVVLFTLNNNTYLNAKKLEKFLLDKQFSFIDSPLDDEYSYHQYTIQNCEIE